MSDFGLWNYYLEIFVYCKYQQQILSLSQHKYIKKIFCNFKINNAKSAITSIKTSKIKALFNGYKCFFKDKHWYTTVYKLLIYAMLKTCIDIVILFLFFYGFFENLSF